MSLASSKGEQVLSSRRHSMKNEYIESFKTKLPQAETRNRERISTSSRGGDRTGRRSGQGELLETTATQRLQDSKEPEVRKELT